MTNKIILEDMEYIQRSIDCEKFAGNRILVSGATGLLGQYLVRFLTEYCGCKVVVIVRNMGKAQKYFGDLAGRVEYIRSDIAALEKENRAVDYIIHGASITSSRSFCAEPAEVIYTSVEGTRRMLEFARSNPVKSFVFLSTMEVYGAPLSDDKIDEKHGTDLNTMSVRSSYPESKRLCESLCAAYFAEYLVPARVVRLTQTIGPGVEYDDPRVFAEFARCAIEGRDIVLHTEGDTKRSYLYLADACAAILTVLAEGKNGEAYNAANEGTYCSIREMAETVATQAAGNRIMVRIEPDRELEKARGYASVLKMNLDTTKLRELGWKPETGLCAMYRRMMDCMQDTVSEKE